MALHLVVFEFVADLDGSLALLRPGIEADLPPKALATLNDLIFSTGLPRSKLSLESLLSPLDSQDIVKESEDTKSSFIARNHQTTAYLRGVTHSFRARLNIPSLTASPPLTVVERAIIAEDGAVTAFKGVTILDQDNNIDPQLSRPELYLAELVTAKAVVDAATTSVAPLTDPAAVSRVTDAVVDVFDKNLRNHLPNGSDKWDGVGRTGFTASVRFYIERNLPVRFVLPAFPCKSPNTEQKVLGSLPDLGEELALRTMDITGRKIKEVYPPGVSFLIVSDGHVFSDLLGVNDDAVVQYGETLRSMAHGMGLSSPFAFRGLDDLLLMDGTSDASLTLLGPENANLEQPLDSTITPDANRARRILLATGGSTEDVLHKEIKENPEVTFLYRGFSRFLLEDLTHPTLVSLPSKSARKNLCLRLAFLMIMRNRAYSALVALMYPLHIRLSIHPHPNSGPKFGIRLIHPSYLHQGRQATAMMEMFHTPTPWHNCIVRDADGSHMLIKKSKLSALQDVRDDIGVSVSMINLTVTMFMLMFALAPLFWASIADSRGRRVVYVASLPIFVAANIALYFTRSYAFLMVFRILQATGAAAVQSVGAGTLADIFPPKERGSAMSLFLLGPQLGPVVGPVVGGLIAQYLGWRWIFALLAVVGAVIWLAIFLLLPETLRSRAGNGAKLAAASARTLLVVGLPTQTSDAPSAPARKSATFNPLAPLKFLQIPSIAMCIAIVAATFGTFYAVTVEVSAIFSSSYGFSTLAVGLSYLGLGLGFVCGSLAGGRASDRMLKAEMKRVGAESTTAVPTEVRVRSAVPGIVCFPTGVVLFGISVHLHWHPAAVIAFMFVLALGMTWTFSCTTTYLVDSFPGSAAGIVALNSLFRNPAASAGSAIIALLVGAIGYAPSYAVFAAVVVASSLLLVSVVAGGPSSSA
ncbi:dityrosine synthesis enzyme [Cladochytrium tenue]|nr:dityrosine synthesis enzyme [Cladochytrium tenue]